MNAKSFMTFLALWGQTMLAVIVGGTLVVLGAWLFVGGVEISRDWHDWMVALIVAWGASGAITVLVVAFNPNYWTDYLMVRKARHGC